MYFPDGHGTEIRVKNEKYVSANKVGIERRLSRTFGPRLPKRSGAPKIPGYRNPYDEMSILFNNEKVFASGPFYEPFEAQPKLDYEQLPEDEKDRGAQDAPALVPKRLKNMETIPTKNIKGRKAVGYAGIIDRGMGHNNEYGFDLIKNGRVIEMNALDRDRASNKEENRPLIGLPARNHYGRIVGQLFLDDQGWKTDHQKTEFLKDDEDSAWSDLAAHVAANIKSLQKISTELQEPQKVGKGVQNKVERGISEIFDASLPSLRTSVQKAARTGKLSQVLATLDKPKSVSKTPAKAPPKLSNTKIVYSKPVIEYDYQGKNAPIFSSATKSSGNEAILKVKINFDHPFLKKFESGERKAIAEFIAAEAYAAFALESKGLTTYEDFVTIRETILNGLLKKL